MDKKVLDVVGEVLKTELHKRDIAITEITSLVKVIEEKVAEQPSRGATGRPGKDGKDGKGEKGDPGESIKGDKGDPGATGRPGESIKGEKGDPGAKGDSIKGDKGDPGATGRPGESIKGDKGDPGAKGDRGESIRGEKGLPGKDGAPGKAGNNGIDAPIHEIRKKIPANGLQRGELLHHRGGVFLTNKTAYLDPSEEPHCYDVVSEGIDEATVKHDFIKRVAELTLHKSSGERSIVEIPQSPSFIQALPKGATLIDGDWDISKRGIYVVEGGKKKSVLEFKLFDQASDVKNILLKLAATNEHAETVESMVHQIAKELQNIYQVYDGKLEDISEKLLSYEGDFKSNRSYKQGQLVSVHGNLYICLKSTAAGMTLGDHSVWKKISYGGGGGGGGSAGGWAGTALSNLNMNNYLINNLKDARTGKNGFKDAVNVQTMNSAIASSALYQGTYQPVNNKPDIGVLTDSGFVPPTAGTAISKPTTAPSPDPADIAVWFDIHGHGLDTFPAVLAAPLAVELYLSDGTVERFNLAAKTYNAVVDVVTEIKSHVSTAITEVHVEDSWLGIETVAPLYCFGTNLAIGGGFPLAVVGAGNTVLNTYNWIVSTVDPNVPEYALPMLPGIKAGTVLRNSDIIQFSSTKNAFEVLRGGNLTQSFADGRYWQVNNGNMEWADGSYLKSAVVLHRESFFQATQNIILGTPEPGTVAAASIWKHLNAAFGSVTFFGRGDFDTTNTTAANNWGMPIGTYPAGRQPQDGDVYFDVLSGSTANFTVVQNPPGYVLTGVLDPLNDTDLGDLTTFGGGPTDINSFSVDGSGLAINSFYKLDSSTAGDITPASGHFAGVTIPASRHYVVWTGDADADNGGWVIIFQASPYNWSTNTPHAQTMPDTITATVNWGYRRNYSIQLHGAEDDVRTILHNFPDVNGVYKITIVDQDTHGSTYEFEVSNSLGTDGLVTPIIVLSSNNHLKKIMWGKVTGHDMVVSVKLGAGADLKRYDIVVTSETNSVAPIQVADGHLAESKDDSSFSAVENYPGPELTNFLKAQSGDASATVPNHLNPGDSLTAQTIFVSIDKIFRYSGRASSHDSSKDFSPLFMIIDIHDQTVRLSPSSGHVDVLSGILTQEGSTPTRHTDLHSNSGGYVDLFPGEVKRGTSAAFQLSFDQRNPHGSIVRIHTSYLNSSNKYVDLEYVAMVKPANKPDRFFYTQHSGADVQWEVFEG